MMCPFCMFGGPQKNRPSWSKARIVLFFGGRDCTKGSNLNQKSPFETFNMQRSFFPKGRVDKVGLLPYSNFCAHGVSAPFAPSFLPNKTHHIKRELTEPEAFLFLSSFSSSPSNYRSHLLPPFLFSPLPFSQRRKPPIEGRRGKAAGYFFGIQQLALVSQSGRKRDSERQTERRKKPLLEECPLEKGREGEREKVSLSRALLSKWSPLSADNLKQTRSSKVRACH